MNRPNVDPSEFEAKDAPEELIWSGVRFFAGRRKILEELTREVEEATTSGFRAIFLLGSEGSGKSDLVTVFQEEAFRAQKKLEAHYVDCARSGWKTWAELAQLFTRSHRLRRSIWKVSSDWMEAIPILGKVLAATGKTVRVLQGEKLVEADARIPAHVSDSPLHAVDMLVEHGPLAPRLLIMDSLDRGDSEDLAGASALLKRSEEMRTCFVAVVRTTNGKAPPAVRDLILEAERLGKGRTIELAGLERDEIREAVNRTTGSEVTDDWLSYLERETRGHPGTLWSLLGALEASGHLTKSGRRWEWADALPARGEVRAGRAKRVAADLPGDVRRLLMLAAVEGAVFHSAVLAELAELPELEVDDRLSPLCRAGLIEFRETPSLGDDEFTSQYAFKNSDDAEDLAAELEEAERASLSGRALEWRSRLGLS